MIKKKFYLFLLVFFVVCQGAFSAVFNKRQMNEISCAIVKTQLFYYYLSPDMDEKLKDYTSKCGASTINLKMPKWLEEEVLRMLEKKVWRDPQEGEISEASMWQTAVSIIYEFLTITKKTFPSEYEGANIQPALLVKEYADIRIRFQMAMDRIYRARLFDSMKGRGRNIAPIFHLILREMESIADAISSNDIKQYSVSATAVGVLAQNAFGQIFSGPRKLDKPRPVEMSTRIMNFALSVAGIILIFLSVRLFFILNKEQTDRMIDSYAKKLGSWGESFSRQFIEVKVQYLVGVPVAVFALMGLLTFSIVGFIVLVLIGVYIGFHMPEWVFNYMKIQRGKKIDAQLMDALILLSNSLKSGLDIVQGFEMVSKDLLPPISDEFALVIKNYQLGMSFEKALAVMENRVASKMLSYMIRAITLQRQMGGNLTKVFERIVIDIREESKLEEKTKALTAQQRIQSIVVGIMPWVMLFIMFIFQGQTMAKFYFRPVGMLVLLLCAVWIMIGMKVVSSLGRIRV